MFAKPHVLALSSFLNAGLFSALVLSMAASAFAGDAALQVCNSTGLKEALLWPITLHLNIDVPLPASSGTVYLAQRYRGSHGALVWLTSGEGTAPYPRIVHAKDLTGTMGLSVWQVWGKGRQLNDLQIDMDLSDVNGRTYRLAVFIPERLEDSISGGELADDLSAVGISATSVDSVPICKRTPKGSRDESQDAVSKSVPSRLEDAASGDPRGTNAAVSSQFPI